MRGLIIRDNSNNLCCSNLRMYSTKFPLSSATFPSRKNSSRRFLSCKESFHRLLTGECKHSNAETFVGAKGERFSRSTKRTERHNPLLRLRKFRRYKAEVHIPCILCYTVLRTYYDAEVHCGKMENDSRTVNS